MKEPFLHRVVTTCFWLSLITVLDAEPGTPKREPRGQSESVQKQIRVQVEFIDVTHAQFTELMFGPKPPANDGELRQQVAQLIKDGKATVVETQLCK